MNTTGQDDQQPSVAMPGVPAQMAGFGHPLFCSPYLQRVQVAMEFLKHCTQKQMPIVAAVNGVIDWHDGQKLSPEEEQTAKAACLVLDGYLSGAGAQAVFERGHLEATMRFFGFRRADGE